jgi:heat shock protein HtpX
LQLALSRAREFDADLDAAGLTGDPRGLASALAKMERCESGFWERILFPGSRIPDPSLLRTHPPTEERIERLLSLAPRKQVAPFRDADEVLVPKAYPTVVVRPRRRFTGLWY